ncbi:MAG: cyclase family protein [Chloroflexi bacterium]|nr:cyclase family protein [Chloroflexota bacterium]
MAKTDTVTKAQLDGWFESISNWGRWGDDDQRGALNLITDAKRAEAASLVRTGAIVSCAEELPKRPAPDNPAPVIHAMQGAGDVTRGGAGGASDMIAISWHGYATTHLDALCHIFHNDQMYNGYPASMVTSIGARLNSIMAGQDGIVSRGVLLDIPAVRGVDYLEPGERILVADLEAAEERQGVRVTPGDILLVCTGRDERNAAEGRWDPMTGGLAGLSGETAPWLRERDVAVLGGDGVSDALPTLVPEWTMPIHALALVALGVHLIDNMQLSRLAAACEDFGRWEFQLTLAPLRLAQGTGSPVNPIALF